MTHDRHKDELREALQLCEIHNERMQYAYHKVMDYFPLNATFKYRFWREPNMYLLLN